MVQGFANLHNLIDTPTYMLKAIGKNIWTMNGPNIVFAGASMHTRMTIVRLTSGDLWVHSPVEYSADTTTALESLGGSVAALVAPNKFHYMYVQQWKARHPDAEVFAESTLQSKIENLRKAQTLTNETPDQYSSDVDQVVLAGNRMFQEVVFFHKVSGTLILTDLMSNLRPDGIKLLPRLFLKIDGSIFPNGGIPRLYRLFTSDKTRAKKALGVIRSWAPKQITFCHGEPFTESADTILKKQFRWLDS